MAEAARRRRARRYPIETRLLYREQGESAWRLGATINVSQSGVLFQADGTPPGMTEPLDFILTLPLNGGSPAPHMRGTGHVVRLAPGSLAGGGHAVAITIDGYELLGQAPV